MKSDDVEKKAPEVAVAACPETSDAAITDGSAAGEVTALATATS